MNQYYFIYKDAERKWRPATNPTFIAMHTYCRAIPKQNVKKLGFEMIADLLWELNGYGKNEIDLTDLISTYELY